MSGQAGPRLAVGPQDLSGGQGTGSCPTPGHSTNELKSREDPCGGTGLAGAAPLKGGAWGRGVPGLGVITGREEGDPSLLPRYRLAYPGSLPQSQAVQCPCPDLEAPWGSGAEGQHAGQGWNVSLLWLAVDSGPPGSGAHEGMYGGYHTSIGLRLPKEAPVPPSCGFSAPAGKGSSLFQASRERGGGRIPWDAGGWRVVEGVLRGGSPWPGKGAEANRGFLLQN